MAQCHVDRPLSSEVSYLEPRLETPAQLMAPPPTSPEYILWGYDDTSQTGWYVLCPQEATNLVKNPTFFNSLSSWSGFNSNIYRQSNFAFDSGSAMRITGSGDIVTGEKRAYAETQIDGYNDGQFYTASVYLWAPEYYSVNDPYFATISIVDVIGGGEEEVFSEKITYARRWQRLEVSKLIREGAEEVYVRINLRSEDQTFNNQPFDPTGFFNLESEFVFADMVQFEIGSQATTPFHGDSGSVCGTPTGCGHYNWLEAAHDGPSHRSDCARDGGVLCSLSDMGFHILSMTGDAPQVSDVSTPYANRPGEFCETKAIGSRLITLNGYTCGASCDFFNVMSKFFPNSGGDCCGEFLLIFRHDTCTDQCETSRDLAICVNYIGGLDGTINDLFQRRVALQFKAHNPFFFEFPGHTSTTISLGNATISNHAALIKEDGSLQGFPLDGGLDVSSIECAANGIAVVGGDFTMDEAENLAIMECSEFCDNTTSGIGAVTDLARDQAGNIIIGTENGTLIWYPSLGTYGSFPGGPGGVLAVAAPQWAEVVVGTSDGVYVQAKDGTWTYYATDGAVNDIRISHRGDIMAVGDFTTINGVQANGAAVLKVTTGTWISFPEESGFDGTLTAIAYDPTAGIAYVGGDALTATPYPQDTCIVTSGQQFESSGSNQELHFRDMGGEQYQFEIRMTNVTTQALANYCANIADERRFIRITATSTLGTKYSFLIGDFNITGNWMATVPTDTDGDGTDDLTLYAITFAIDRTQSLGDPCDTLNPSFVAETEDTKAWIRNFALLDLPGGTGIDNEINSVSIQCVQLEDTYQGDSTAINYVAKVSYGSISTLGNGLPNPVTNLFVHPLTGNLFAMMDTVTDAYPNGLAEWNGVQWITPSIATNSGLILDMAWCPNSCGLMVLYEGSALITPSAKELNVCASADIYDPQLVVTGPGTIQHFDVNDRIMSMDTELQCEENAIYDFGKATFQTTDGRALEGTVLAGSRKDMVLKANCTNKLSLLIDPETQDAETSATLLWRNQHWSAIGTHCCVCIGEENDKGTYADVEAYVTCCSQPDPIQLRDPNDCDDETQGWRVGDEFINLNAACPKVFINMGEGCCPDYTDLNIGAIDSQGNILHYDQDENTDDPVCF